MVDVREYIERGGRSPFGKWYANLSTEVRRKVPVAVYRIELGNLSNAKSVGGGVFEFKINFGSGYRIYFGNDGDHLIILLGGGSKRRNSKTLISP